MLNSSTCSSQISLHREESFLGLKNLCIISMSALHVDNFLMKQNQKIISKEKLSAEITFEKRQ